LDADVRIQQHRLGALLNSGELFLPDGTDFQTQPSSAVVDTTQLGSHPLVSYYRGQLGLAKAQSAIDRSRLAPTVGLGYSNLSMVGWQTADGVNQKYYGAGQRFQTFNLTLGIPLLNGALRSRLKAGEVTSQAIAIQTEAAQAQLRSQWQQAAEELIKTEAQLQYYRKQGLPQAELVLNQARLAYEKGELSYTDRNILMNQAVQIRISYLDALHAWHLAQAEYIYITGK
jgi:heavy metal efflux system protein